MPNDPGTLVDLERYPIHDLLNHRTVALTDLLDFIALVLEAPALYRYDDDLGAVNVAMMRAGDELAWHFDQTDFVVSIALQSSESGGDFECVPMLRTSGDERYPDVAATLAGRYVALLGYDTKPGTCSSDLLRRVRYGRTTARRPVSVDIH